MKFVPFYDYCGNLVTEQRMIDAAAEEARAYIGWSEAASRCGITRSQLRALVKEEILPQATRNGKWDHARLKDAVDLQCFTSKRIGTGWVYFMQMGHFIKIGWSTWPPARRDDLQGSSPHKISLLCAFPSTMDTEPKVHSMFSHVKHRGEWFRKSPGLVAYIELLRAKWKHNPDFLR